ncbi:MAG TPA: hypothetical protein VK619_10350 [Pyrinomonadaceae bacterium]|nr:hypothetical protein [Pyrinomonadaceae bacterium]
MQIALPHLGENVITAIIAGSLVAFINWFANWRRNRSEATNFDVNSLAVASKSLLDAMQQLRAAEKRAADASREKDKAVAEADKAKAQVGLLEFQIEQMKAQRKLGGNGK